MPGWPRSSPATAASDEVLTVAAVRHPDPAVRADPRREAQAPGPAGDRVVDGPARPGGAGRRAGGRAERSEEHTSELQSLMRISYAVFCLKKKKKDYIQIKQYSLHEQPVQNTQK